MKHNAIIYLMVMLLAACSASDDGNSVSFIEDPVAVSFSTDMSSSTTATTRATTGNINNLDALKKVPEGFGVFAYLTDATQFNTTDFKDKDNSTTKSFSNFFMFNQQVTWGNQCAEKDENGVIKKDAFGNELWHKDWVYSPLKYWPNYSNNDNTTPGPRYISFFAYAPHVTAEAGASSGIVNYTRADDRTPHIIYKVGAADQQVDVLWAAAIDAKRNGNGLITVNTSGEPPVTTLEYEKVPLHFKHALSGIDIYVQRVYDEPAFTGKIPKVILYPTLYISKLELTSDAPATGKNALQKSGKLSLIDGTWEDDGTWKGSEDEPVTITYDESVINDTIRGTANNDEEYIRDIELDKWKWILDTKNTSDTSDDEWVDATAISEEDLAAEPTRWKSAYGVSEDERHLFKNALTQMLLPRKVTLIPKLTYSMVVRDDELMVNYFTDSEGHKYSRIINEIEGNSITLDLQAGKRYTLLIRIGVEHVEFILVNVVDWDFPMRYTPTVVTGFEKENIGHKLDEE